MLLGHLVYLKAKAGGENSMPEKRGPLEALKVPSRKTRAIGRKLHCLNPNPQRWNVTPAATASITQRPRGRIVTVSRSATSDREGDEERLH